MRFVKILRLLIGIVLLAAMAVLLFEYVYAFLILFAPMGVFLPAVYKSSRLRHILIMVIVLILIETVQLITGLGIFDIDDILLNFAGFFIVYWIWQSKIVEKIKKKLCIWI